MKNIFLSLLIAAGVSMVSVIIYTEFISLYGKGCYFFYVKLFFALSIIGGGGGGLLHFIHNKKGRFYL